MQVPAALTSLKAERLEGGRSMLLLGEDLQVRKPSGKEESERWQAGSQRQYFLPQTSCSRLSQDTVQIPSGPSYLPFQQQTQCAAVPWMQCTIPGRDPVCWVQSPGSAGRRSTWSCCKQQGSQKQDLTAVALSHSTAQQVTRTVLLLEGARRTEEVAEVTEEIFTSSLPHPSPQQSHHLFQRDFSLCSLHKQTEEQQKKL